MDFKKVQQSNKEEQKFNTGSKRDSREGKGRYDLISPIALKRLAVHYENGARRYQPRNWERGQPMSRYFDSAVRHLYTYLGGSRDEDHLAAVVWNVMAMIHTEELVSAKKYPAELNDMPNRNN